MNHRIAIYILAVVATIALVMGCGERRAQAGEGHGSEPQPKDTVYTQRAALMVYDYDPVRALQIIDSAVIVGNMSDWWAEKNRARVYSQTRAGAQLDSLMHWTPGARFDSARTIGTRLLQHDSIKGSLEGQQDVLEMLAYTARRQNDSTAWLKWSRQLVDVCRRQGAETEALRNEAEVGAALCRMGRQREGMALLDRAIDSLEFRTESLEFATALPTSTGSQADSGAGSGTDSMADSKADSSADSSADSMADSKADSSADSTAVANSKLYTLNSKLFRFNELDALVVALKRKIGVMTANGQTVEVLPLARRIVKLLNDYEAHPDLYHDDSYREPPAEKCDDYIRFYRTQAENYIASAYAALGETGDMAAIFERLENIVREADTREHLARYRALELQMQRQAAEARAEREQARADRIRTLTASLFFLLLLAAGFAVVLFRKNKDIRLKNRILAQQILREKVIVNSEKFAAAQLSSEDDAAEANSCDPSVASEQDPSSTSHASLNTEELYRHIRDEVQRLQLYTDPRFGRQSVIERFHLPKDVASSVFSQGSSEHDNISSFITDCRLKHAHGLLLSRPDMSIGDIAAAAGFGVRKSFTRSFKAKYGLTPTEFREQSRLGKGQFVQ